MTKPEARRRAAAILAGMTPEEAARRSRGAVERLRSTHWWHDCPVVLTFLSMPGELDTASLVASGLAEGKTVAVPVIRGPEIFFRVIHGLAEDLPRDRYGIPQPDPASPPWAEAPQPGPVLVVTPGMAFDAACHRLGRGKGLYDRFLARLRGVPALEALAIGLAFEAQVIEAVPFEEHDAPLDGVVTEARVILPT